MNKRNIANTPRVTYIIRTLRIREVTPFPMVEYSKASWCTKSLSNYIRVRFDLAITSTKYVSPEIVHLVKVFAIARAFQEFTIIVKECPFTSTFGARSLSSINSTQKKKIPWYSEKDALKSIFVRRMP